jgi:type I restriction enzyme S subunit
LDDFEQVSFNLPSNWKWTKLDHLCSLITDGTHHTPKYTKNGVPFLSVKNVSSGDIDLTDTKFISEDEHQTLIKRCHPEFEDVLLTKVGTTGICKVIDIDFEFSIFVSLALLKFPKKYIYPYYLELAINSPFVKEQSKKNTQGVGNKNLVLKHIKNFDIPLPPLEEQKRIVAKVDQLMELCDHLESLQQKKQESHIHLNNAALNKMLSASSPEEFEEQWRLVCDNFGLLYDNLENVEKLKQSILQLAVMGKLVEQDADDEPASSLISNIIAGRNQWYEKELLAASSEGRRKPKKPKLKRTEVPESLIFPTLPNSWDICFFEDIAANKENAIKAGPFGSALTKKCYVPSGYKIYGQEQVIREDASFGDYYIDHKKYSKLKSCEVAPRDILISLVGTIGKVLILPENCEPGIINPRLIKLSLDDSISKEYIKLYLYSPLAKRILADESHGGTMDILNLRILKKLPIPLPPLEEQKRIVAKVDQLMVLCDRLEAGIRQAQEDGEKLMEVAVSGLLVSCG